MESIGSFQDVQRSDKNILNAIAGEVGVKLEQEEVIKSYPKLLDASVRAGAISPTSLDKHPASTVRTSMVKL